MHHGGYQLHSTPLPLWATTKSVRGAPDGGLSGPALVRGFYAIGLQSEVHETSNRTLLPRPRTSLIAIEADKIGCPLLKGLVFVPFLSVDQLSCNINRMVYASTGTDSSLRRALMPIGIMPVSSSSANSFVLFAGRGIWSLYFSRTIGTSASISR